MSNNKQSILLNGYWVIGTNKWDANIYTQDQSEKYADTLINCSNCINCSDCSNCNYCRYCRDCRDCSNCGDCSFCIDCSDCSFCIDCSDCSFCIDCRYCSNCSNCNYCNNCSNCNYCRYCRDCRDFKTNPERITSPLLGSRNGKTTYYFNEEKDQIVCGCFKGTLEQFEIKIKENHGENQYAQGYFKWIEKVKIYRQ